MKFGMYKEARNFFLDDDNNTITQEEFFCDNKFAAVIDMRTINDKNVNANGREIINTQEGVSIEIEKGTTAKDLTCYMFVALDRLINI